MAMTREELNAYNRRHDRRVRLYGRAPTHPCAHCAEHGIDKPAHDWATIHGTDGENLHTDYIALCKKCHHAYDDYGHHTPHSEATKALLSRKNRGYKHKPEAVEKIRAASAGRKHTPESIAKMSKVQKAQATARGPMSPEQRAKISDSLRRNTNAAGAVRIGGRRAGTGRAPGNPNIGKTRAAQQRAKTHCPQDHALTPDNVYLRGPDKKNRQCRTCTRERAAARYEKQREAAEAARANGTALPSRRAAVPVRGLGIRSSADVARSSRKLRRTARQAMNTRKPIRTSSSAPAGRRRGSARRARGPRRRGARLRDAGRQGGLV